MLFRGVFSALIISATEIWAGSEVRPVSDPPLIKAPDAGSETEPNAIDRVLELCAALRIDEVTQVLQSEGQGYGTELDRDVLDGRGGAYWTDLVEDIFGAKRMADKVSMALLAEMTPGQIDNSRHSCVLTRAVVSFRLNFQPGSRRGIRSWRTRPADSMTVRETAMIRN